jgi:hypothetical protein
MEYLLILPYLVIIVYFSIMQVVSLCSKESIMAVRWDSPALIIGFLFHLFYFFLAGFQDYNVSIIREDMSWVYAHAPFASWHLPTLLCFAVISMIGYMILRHAKRELPPLAMALCLSAILFGFLLCVVFILQLGENLHARSVLIPLIYPFNVLMLYGRLMRHHATALASRMRERNIDYENPVLKACATLLHTGRGCWISALKTGLKSSILERIADSHLPIIRKLNM